MILDFFAFRFGRWLGVSYFRRLVPDASSILCLRLLLLLCVFLRLGFLIAALLLEFDNDLLSIFGQTVMRIAVQEFFECPTRLGWVVQIIFVDFADREKSVCAILAARILLAQKLVLSNRFFEDLVVVKAPAHLDQHLGNGYRAGIGPGGNGCAVVDIAEGIDNSLII